MSAEINRIGAVATTGGNSGNSGNNPAQDSDDATLSGVAHDVLCTVVDMLGGDDDLAARTMLLAVAWLMQDDPNFGRTTALSSMLIEATRNTLDAFHNRSAPSSAAAGAVR